MVWTMDYNVLSYMTPAGHNSILFHPDPTPHQTQPHGHAKSSNHRESVGYVDMSTGMKGSSGAGDGYLSMATGGNYIDQVSTT